MKVNFKNAVTIIGVLSTFISFSRVCVLFLESLSTVRDERQQDAELLVACANGVARGSMKMRSACLQAQSDRASPIVLKAILRAVLIAFQDFTDSISSPGKLMVVLLFVVISIFIPLTNLRRNLFPDTPVEYENSHIVVLAGPTNNNNQFGIRNRLKGVFTEGRKRLRSQDESDCIIELGNSFEHPKWN
jgi:hypothetical protein